MTDLESSSEAPSNVDNDVDRVIDNTLAELKKEENVRALHEILSVETTEIGNGYSMVIPGGNITFLLENPNIDHEQVARIAKTILGKGLAEQVGILDTTDTNGSSAKLKMMGGEFCLNGIRSVAALLYSRFRASSSYLISCSGCDEIVECLCEPIDEENNRFRVETTLMMHPEIIELEENVALVRLEGISHFLCEETSDEEALKTKSVTDLMSLMQKHKNKIEGDPAVGAIFYAEHERGGIRIQPVVHVRKTETSIVETGCGSGSIALAMYLNTKDASQSKIPIMQPSNSTYSCEVNLFQDDDNVLTYQISLAGTVEVAQDFRNT